MARVVTFSVGGTRFGLPLTVVERVVAVPWITPLPKAPTVVLGVIDLHGRPIAVISLRRRFGFRERDIELSDRLVVARTRRRTVALHVDAVGDVVTCPDHETVESDRVIPGIGHVAGLALLDDGLLLIQDLGTVLSLEEEQALEEAFGGGA